MEGIVLLIVVLLPLLVVGVLYMRSLASWATRWGPLSALPLLGMVLFDVAPERAELSWVLMGAFLGVDDTAKVFLLATGLVWVVAAIFAHATEIKGGKSPRFFQFFYAAMAGNFLLIVAGDMITFLSGFSLMSYAGFGLVIHRLDEQAARASRVYIALVVFAEVTLFAGAILAWSLTGSLEFDALREALGTDQRMARVAIVLLFCGFGVKAGMMPLHFWLPLAHPAAPVPASAVLSAAMIKAGLLGWMRFLPFGHEGLTWLGWWGFSAGLIAVFAGVILGLFQSHPKVILAYSSISQMGYMLLLLAISALVPQLAAPVMMALLLYVVHHAVAKGSLFLAVTVARDAPHSRWWSVLESTGLVIPAFALAGAPLTTGAAAKHMIAELPHIEETLPWFFDPALIMGALATTVLMVRFLWVVWPRKRRKVPISKVAMVIWLVLSTSVVWAMWMVPWTLFQEAAAGMLEPYAIWSSAWPLMLGMMLSIFVLRKSDLFPFRVISEVPAGDIVVLVERISDFGAHRAGRARVAMEDAWAETQKRIAAWVQTQRRYLRTAQVLEERLQKQAWDWFWILLVGAAVMVAIHW